ncbi:unnamed protein product, partial [Allacma fusca]
MEVNPSYKTLQEKSQVYKTSSKQLVELCEDILKDFKLSSFTNQAEVDSLRLYVEQNDMPQTKAEITKILTILFQAPNITVNENRNDILEVTGKHLLVSDVLKSIEGYSFKELRLVAGLTIFLDADFPQDR